LITKHSNDGIVPKIPGELKIFIHKQGEKALGKWRRENNIPDSDGLAALMEDQQKMRQIRYTFSDSHDAKRAKITSIPD